MRKTFSGFAAIIIAAGLATTAQAETKPNTPAPIGSDRADAKPAKDQRYCLQGKVVGSNIVQRDCKTRAQWLREGFDPLDPK